MKAGKHSRGAGILAAALLLVVACGGSPSKLPAPLGESIVTVGFKAYPGISEDNVGIMVGFEAFARKSILNNAGVKKFAPTLVGTNNWDSKLAGRDVHLVMGMISDSDTRADHFQFARSYLRTDLGLLTRADAEVVGKEEDLAKKKICTVQNTAADATMMNREKIYSLVRVTVPTPEECIKMVKDGDAYAYSTDRIILMGFSIHPDSIDDGTKKSFYRVLDLPLGRDQHISIALHKEDGKACQLLVDAIKKYVESSDWLTDLRRHLIDEYFRRAPDGGDMTDDEIGKKFQPSEINADRCVDPPQANAVR
jgi:glutamate transport system substrate-binding protein